MKKSKQRTPCRLSGWGGRGTYPHIYRVDGVDGCASARSSPMYQGARFFAAQPPRIVTVLGLVGGAPAQGWGETPQHNRASVIDTLANLKRRLDSVKRMTQIHNTSQSIAATKNFRIETREHTLAPPGRQRPRHSQMSLTTCQNTQAIDAAIYRPDSTLYQLQPSFHAHSTEPEPTARARRAGKEFY